MTFTSEYGEQPDLGEFVHQNRFVVNLTTNDLSGTGRQKIADALLPLGVDPAYVRGVVLSAALVYELDKRGGYVVEGNELVIKEIPL